MKRILLFLLLFFWILWANLDWNSKLSEVQGYVTVIESLTPQKNSLRNVIAIQPFMVESDYLLKERFQRKMEIYLEKSKESGFIGKFSIVLLPEYLGTWLVIQNEKTSIAKSSSLMFAMLQLILSNPFRFIEFFPESKSDEDRIASTLFRSKAKLMARTYQETFSYLARKYNVYISAGSIVLPDPRISDNQIQINPKGKLQNSSFLFLPDGSIHPHIVKKVFPIESEKPFITPSNLETIAKFPLEIGQIGILICADSWYPEPYKKLQGAELVLVNSYCAQDGSMNMIWKGYSGAETPSDIDLKDIGRIKEKEAWMKYSLPGRIHLSRARHGVLVFLRGHLWNLGSDGYPIFVSEGKLLNPTPTDKAGIYQMAF